MTSTQGVCYTFEAAIEMAITMEERCYRAYLVAIRTVKDKSARSILIDAAIEEVNQKHQLEIALIQGNIDNMELLQQEVPMMNLDYFLEQKKLSADADARQALAYIIHGKKEGLEFYEKLTSGCSGAPMAPVFQQLAADESKNLQKLEDLFEEHFLTEN
ncbi:MAG: ferritin [Desulfuromonas sp.]|nr:ferritin [Desulfuromonas sp.]